jgi:hypothetical protein
MSKPHYLATKTYIQLLCNYPLGTTSNVQRSPQKYNLLLNKLSCQKISYLYYSCKWIENGFLYGNLYTSYIHMSSTMFDFFWNCIVVTCGNYFRTIVNVQLVYNTYMQSCHIFTFPPAIMGYICNKFSIMIPIDIISMATSVPLLKYCCSTMLWL